MKDMNKKKTKRKFSIVEMVWYIFAGLLAIWGITYIVLGLVGKFAAIPLNDNAIQKASDSYAKTFGLGFFGWGLIHLAVAALVAVSVLLYYSKAYDRIYEKEERRKALREYSKNKIRVNEAQEEFVVEAEPVNVEPAVEETAPVEESV